MNLILGSFLNYLYNNIITHVPIHGLRLFFLRIFNKQIESSAIILMHCRLLNFWNLQIGKRTIINQYCLLDCRRYKIIIDEDVDIGPYCKIWTLGHNPDSSDHGLYGGDIIIKDHVWISSGVTILPNVEIGRGAVIGSASVLTKNVNSLEIMAGNPAKFIRIRNNDLKYKLKYNPILE